MHVCMSLCMYVCKHTIQPAALEGNVLPSMNKNIAITFFLWQKFPIIRQGKDTLYLNEINIIYFMVKI
jgi:hypothetical protein